MKDKRQRMALTWPYANPHLAAYMFAAAAAAYGQTQGAYWNTAAAAATAAANAATGGAQSAQNGNGDSGAPGGHGPISPSMYSVLPPHLYHPLMMQPQGATGAQAPPPPPTSAAAAAANFLGLGLQLNTDNVGDSIDLNKSLPSGGSGDGTSHSSSTCCGSPLSSPASSPVQRSSPEVCAAASHFNARPLVVAAAAHVLPPVTSHSILNNNNNNNNIVTPPTTETSSSSGPVKKLFQPYKIGEEN